MKRYWVTGVVVGLGQRKHSIKAPDQKSAWAKFQAAYLQFECVHVETRRGYDG